MAICLFSKMSFSPQTTVNPVPRMAKQTSGSRWGAYGTTGEGADLKRWDRPGCAGIGGACGASHLNHGVSRLVRRKQPVQIVTYGRQLMAGKRPL